MQQELNELMKEQVELLIKIQNLNEKQMKMDEEWNKGIKEKQQFKVEFKECKEKCERLEKEIKDAHQHEQTIREELLKCQKDYQLDNQKKKWKRFLILKSIINYYKKNYEHKLMILPSKNDQIQNLTQRMDKTIIDNAHLQEQVERLETELKSTVSQEKWDSLKAEYQTLEKDLTREKKENQTLLERISLVESEKQQWMEQCNKLKRDITEREDEISQLESHQNFWKTRANSIQQELRHILSDVQPNHPSNKHAMPNSQKTKKQFDKKVKKLEEEKESAEPTMKKHRKTFGEELTKNKK